MHARERDANCNCNFDFLIQALSSTPSRSATHTDYYVVMSPGTNRAVSQVRGKSWIEKWLQLNTIYVQEESSDHSGDSVVSHREHLALLDRNRHLEGLVVQNSEEVKKLTSRMEHLTRRVESLANQFRIMNFPNGVSQGSQGSEVSSSSGGGSPSMHMADRRSSPICVDHRPPAPLPGEPPAGECRL